LIIIKKNEKEDKKYKEEVFEFGKGGMGRRSFNN